MQDYIIQTEGFSLLQTFQAFNKVKRTLHRQRKEECQMVKGHR